jgi:hypothetical protein
MREWEVVCKKRDGNRDGSKLCLNELEFYKFLSMERQIVASLSYHLRCN